MKKKYIDMAKYLTSNFCEPISDMEKLTLMFRIKPAEFISEINRVDFCCVTCSSVVSHFHFFLFLLFKLYNVCYTIILKQNAFMNVCKTTSISTRYTAKMPEHLTCVHKIIHNVLVYKYFCMLVTAT